jgi:hypothetical protein
MIQPRFSHRFQLCPRRRRRVRAVATSYPAATHVHAVPRQRDLCGRDGRLGAGCAEPKPRIQADRSPVQRRSRQRGQARSFVRQGHDRSRGRASGDYLMLESSRTASFPPPTPLLRALRPPTSDETRARTLVFTRWARQWPPRKSALDAATGQLRRVLGCQTHGTSQTSDELQRGFGPAGQRTGGRRHLRISPDRDR